MPSEDEIDKELENLVATSKIAKKFLLVDLVNKEIPVSDNNVVINLEERTKEKPMITVIDKKKKIDDLPGLF